MLTNRRVPPGSLRREDLQEAGGSQYKGGSPSMFALSPATGNQDALSHSCDYHLFYVRTYRRPYVERNCYVEETAV